MSRYAERRHIPYSPQQMFDLVADVERYPDFLPWLVAARIRRREGNMLSVEMVVGNNLLRRSFSSQAVLDPPRRIDIKSLDSMFERYDQHWRFELADDGGTIVDFRVDFEFRFRMLQLIMGGFLQEAASAMVGAFNRRARALYGPAKVA
jgi:coenzyme Q-binding protein COQ10